MSKSILMIDTPNTCIQCPCYTTDGMDDPICGYTGTYIRDFQQAGTRLDDCPLVDVPDVVQGRGNCKSLRTLADYLEHLNNLDKFKN